MMDLLTRLRAILGTGVVALAVGSGWFLVGPPDVPPPTIRIAAFNIQVFGRTKASKPEVMDVLVRTAREFDVVVVQEIRDSREQVADDFLAAINADADVLYSMFEGERLGRTSSKEQYVVYYRQATIELVEAHTHADLADAFEREPLIATLRADSFDFTLVAVHIKPSDAEQELRELEAVVNGLLDPAAVERDVIVLGDFNADCRYLDEDAADRPLSAEEFHWVIGNEVITTTRSECTYDRIILTDDTFGSEYVQGSAQEFRFDDEYGIVDQDFVRSVSDHYPVFAEFVIGSPDDDP